MSPTHGPFVGASAAAVGPGLHLGQMVTEDFVAVVWGYPGENIVEKTGGGTRGMTCPGL